MRKNSKGKVGAFHDLNSFRLETQLTPNDISDNDAWKVINEDMAEQKRLIEKEKNRVLQEKYALEQKNASLQNELSNSYYRNSYRYADSLLPLSNNNLSARSPLIVVPFRDEARPRPMPRPRPRSRPKAKPKPKHKPRSKSKTGKKKKR